MNLSVFTNPYWTLNHPSLPVFFGESLGVYSDYKQFEEDFKHLMIYSKGIGLAANQVGITKRIFAIGHESFDVFLKPAILYNAKIIKASEEVEIGEEGCLSFPDTYYNVYRAKQIEVEWQTMKGETEGAMLSGLEARCFQHELDHINGITFNQRAEEINN